MDRGRVLSTRRIDKEADVIIEFETKKVGISILMPPINWLKRISTGKNFQLVVRGNDEMACHFLQTLMAFTRIGWKAGIKSADGLIRYTTQTNGGPCFVYVKDGRIIRITPIDLSDEDAPSWTIRARGHEFTPPRKATVSPHALNLKSIVYSPDRILYGPACDWAIQRRRFASDRSRQCKAFDAATPYIGSWQFVRNGCAKPRQGMAGTIDMSLRRVIMAAQFLFRDRNDHECRR